MSGGWTRGGGSRAARRGSTLAALPFWVLGLALFALPFLREQDRMSEEGADAPLRSDLDIPFEEDVAVFEEEFGLELGSAIAEASEEGFALDSPRLRSHGLVDERRVRAGRVAYERHCIGCHGESGNGAGPAALHLEPRPRNFRRGVFKFTSTDTGERPLRTDLFRTITRGLAGSSMPEFRLLSEEVRWDLTEYVRYLSIRGEFEQLALDLAWEDEELPDFEEVEELVVERWHPDEQKAVYPAVSEPDYDEESVDRGHELFLDTTVANCAACHGESGRGDGPSAEDFDDDWGYPIVPRDLTTGVYRAGSGSDDLYRSIATGINGTPMGSFSSSIEPEDIWHLVHYVQSLARD